MPLVASGAAFGAGIKTEALTTYRRRYELNQQRLSRAMRLDLTAVRRTETFFYYLAAPHMGRWPYGETIQEKAFGGIKFTTTVQRWGRRISWHWDDRMDDQTNGLLERARDLGRSAALIDERVLFQVLTGATDEELLPSVPNAPDGAAIFATTAGGSARFGATNGNLLTGAGVTAANFRTDYWAIRKQFRLFQDGEGQPLLDDDTIDGDVLIIYGAGNEDAVGQAFGREIIQGSSAGISDEFRDRLVRKTPLLWSTQRITDNDWFGILVDGEHKPVVSLMREPLSEHMQVFETSDRTKDTDIESIQFKLRKAHTVFLPYSAIKVNN